MWANRWICSYSDFNLAYVAEFQYKNGVRKQKKQTVGMETFNTHFLLTVYILYKELSSLRILSSPHKATKSHIFMIREHLCIWPKNQSFAQW